MLLAASCKEIACQLLVSPGPQSRFTQHSRVHSNDGRMSSVGGMTLRDVAEIPKHDGLSKPARRAQKTISRA